VEPGDRDVFRRWRMAVVFPLLDPGREVLGFFVLGRKRSGTAFTRAEIDVLGLIADQAAVAAARINLQQKLLVRYAETERLEELNRIKSDFVSSVSHELKTPLTSIKMMAEMLQGSPRTPHAKVRRYAEVLEGEADRLTRLIDNILDFSKIERGVKEYAMTGTNLNDAVVRVMEIMAYPLAMESFTPTVTLAADPGTIQADPDALAGALLNIVSNGMKYSPERREIGVETYRRGDVSGVTVRDRGVGIAAGERETIFEPFFRGAAARCASIGGVGLGLTLVKHFLDAHRATIALEDVPGGGTSVSLLFPLAPPERTAPA
jgi:signal transduction histidine kinase